MTTHPTSDDMLNAQMALVRDRMAEVDALMGWGFAAEAPPPPWALRGKRSDRPTHLHEWVAVADELADAHGKIAGVIDAWRQLLMMREVMKDPTNTERTMRLAKATRDARQESKANAPAPTLADRLVDAMENALAELGELADGPSVTVRGSASEEEARAIREGVEKEVAAAEQAICDVALMERIVQMGQETLEGPAQGLASWDRVTEVERLIADLRTRNPLAADAIVERMHAMWRDRGQMSDVPIGSPPAVGEDILLVDRIVKIAADAVERIEELKARLSETADPPFTQKEAWAFWEETEKRQEAVSEAIHELRQRNPTAAHAVLVALGGAWREAPRMSWSEFIREKFVERGLKAALEQQNGRMKEWAARVTAEIVENRPDVDAAAVTESLLVGHEIVEAAVKEDVDRMRGPHSDWNPSPEALEASAKRSIAWLRSRLASAALPSSPPASEPSAGLDPPPPSDPT